MAVSRRSVRSTSLEMRLEASAAASSKKSQVEGSVVTLSNRRTKSCFEQRQQQEQQVRVDPLYPLARVGQETLEL